MDITVLMSVYNGEQYIKQSIESILSQSYIDFEFIIVDDCSSDSTRKIVDSYRDARILVIKNNANLGLAASLNKGIQAARGKYIIRQDYDDLSVPDRIYEQYMFIKENDSDAVFCRYKYMTKSGVLIGKPSSFMRSDGIKSALFNKDNPLMHGAALIKKEVLLALGGYNEKFFYTQDYELWVRMLALGYKLDMVDYIGCYHRLSYKNNKRKWQAQYTEMVFLYTRNNAEIPSEKLDGLISNMKNSKRKNRITALQIVNYIYTLLRLAIR